MSCKHLYYSPYKNKTICLELYWTLFRHARVVYWWFSETSNCEGVSKSFRTES